MAAPHPLSVEEVFAEALLRPPGAERAGYLEQACGDDLDLRRRVDRLLRAHEEAGEFLAGSGPHATLDATQDSPANSSAHAQQDIAPGMMIGPYKLLDEIGEGGFGVVFMAEQLHPVRRKVALKIIKPGMDSRQVVARFEAERQALAIMDHPNIAKVFDGGATPSGVPYFVMELVKGAPITDFCDQHHLTARQRLELFVHVCQAVQHAHQKGIIHRDLKPSNVLVALHDTVPVPKVIDFGVAKALGRELTDSTVFTGIAQMIGTPLYMSPEQAGQNPGALGDIDTRSDIYSLGVLLYELLTGATPFDKERFRRAAYDEIRRIIREEDPPKPSTRLSDSKDSLPSVSAQRHTEPAKLTKLVRGELDWIVMKALEKDRNRRYETANGFAADVQRYLCDEPVLACPPSVGYRFRKFARRNKLSLAAIATALLFLLCAVGGLAVNNYLIREEQARTEEARQAEVRRRQQATEALDAMTSMMLPDRLGQHPALTEEHKRFLQQALKTYVEFAADTGEDEATRRNVAAAHQRVGRIHHQLGQTREAEIALARAEALYASLSTDYPGVPAYRDEYTRTLNSQGNLLQDLGRTDEALAAYQRVASLLEELVAEYPENADQRLGLAAAYNNLAALQYDLGRHKESETAFRRSMELLEELIAESPRDAKYQFMRAVGEGNLANLLLDLGRHADAEAAYRAGVTRLERLVNEFPDDPEYPHQLGQVLMNFRSMLSKLGKQEEAEEAARQSVAVLELLTARFPTVPSYQLKLAAAYNALGPLQSDRGKHPDAEASYRRALAILAPLTANFPDVPAYRLMQGVVLFNRGNVLASLGHTGEAEKTYRSAVSLFERLDADIPGNRDCRQNWAQVLASLANLRLALGHAAEAEALCRKSLTIKQKLADEFRDVVAYRDDVAGVTGNIGAALAEQGNYSEAATHFQSAAALYEQLATEFPAIAGFRQWQASSLQNLGQMQTQLGESADAEASLRKAISIFLELADKSPDDPQYRLGAAGCYNNLGQVLEDVKQFEQAESTFEQAIAIGQKLADEFPQVPRYRQVLSYSVKNLALMLGRNDRFADAEAAYRRALAVREQLVAEFPENLAYVAELGECQAELGHLAHAQDQADVALDWYAKAAEILAPALAENAGLYKARRALLDIYESRAEIVCRRGRTQEALQDWDRAISLAAGPKRLELQVGRTVCLARGGQHAEAMSVAEELSKAGDVTGVALYGMACIFSLSSAAAKDDALLQEQHGIRAVELLRQAVATGYDDIAQLQEDPDLDPLRTRDDFTKLLTELEARLKP